MSEVEPIAKDLRVVIRADADARIGGGHVMRCLALADALAARGATVDFVAALMPDELQRRVEASGHRLLRIPEPPGLRRDGDDWHEPPLAADAQAEDAAATVAAIGGPADWLVVDHYLLNRPWEGAMRPAARRILAIDDLANRAHDCDLLLDQTLGRASSDYGSLVPGHAIGLAGPTFALLRPEFARERPAALKHRQESGPVRRILVLLGTMDLGGVTARALEAVLAAAPNCAVDVILGEAAPSFAKVQQMAGADPRVAVHADNPNIAELMRDADIAVGAGGTSSWERCCLGLPTVLVVLAENQRASAAALEQAGAAIVVDSVEGIGSALATLVADVPRLETMTAAAFAIADGLGASRVVEAMLRDAAKPAPVQPALRPAVTSDAELLWLWRNDPATRSASRNQSPIPWRMHAQWFAAALASSDGSLLIAENEDNEPIGIVRFDRMPGRKPGFEVSINVRPDARGGGAGRAILSAACSHFARESQPGLIHASVHPSNAPSRRLFEACGFTAAETAADDGFLCYVLEPSAPAEADRRHS